MKITEVRLNKFEGDSKVKAFASVTFDNVFAVHDIKIVDGANGLFIAMPSRKTKDGEFKDIAHSTDKDFRKELTDALLEEYNK
ncbi:MAG: SpoVG2 [Clostridiaceae bacterium]|jgi:stage V sporulation protein G|nr:SpoVG2 [Clostridiaceae bacterium]